VSQEADTLSPSEGEGEVEVLAVEQAEDYKHTRNLSIIAHVDHGKTTLSDCLLAAAGQLSEKRAGSACALDKGLEAERGITIYSTAVSLEYPARGLRVNLVDCPGHAEFNSEVTAALRLTDGALLLVDVKEGVMPQTEAVLRQALVEGVRPVLVLNKFDKLLPATREQRDGARMPVDQEMTDRMYEQMAAVISRVNEIIVHAAAPDAQVSLEAGSVVFGSAKQGWMAGLGTFAELYAAKATANGDATAHATAKAKALRAMSQGKGAAARIGKMVLAPLAELHALAGEVAHAEIGERLSKMGAGLKLDKETMALQDVRELRRRLLSALLPAAPALLNLATHHLPPPSTSQSSRVSALCPPPTGVEVDEDLWSSAVGACDPAGPLVLYVSKSVPLLGSKAQAAVCRIFSGTVYAGQEVYVLPPSDERARKPLRGRVSRVLRFSAGAPPSALRAARAGEVCALLGLEKVLPRAGTVSSDHAARPLTSMNFAVSLVARRAVSAPAGGAARKLAEALPALRRSDPLVRCEFDKETKEWVVHGAGELHIEACAHRLRELMGTFGERLIVSPAAVAHRESVNGCTPRTDARPGALGKTANKHNRFWLVASALSDELLDEMEREGSLISPAADPATRARRLVSKYGWDAKHARRILGFAPGGAGPNLFVDATVGVQGVDCVVEHLLAAFEQLCAEGPLCGEQLRGVRFDLTDAKIHSEAAQRRASQVVPAARRALAAAMLSAQPTLLEPLHAVSLRAPLSWLGEVYEELSLRRVVDASHEPIQGEGDAAVAVRDALCEVRGYLPLTDAEGLTEKLRGRLHGKASGLHLAFDHFSKVEGEPWCAEASDAGKAVAAIRARKSMEGNPPTAEMVGDKL